MSLEFEQREAAFRRRLAAELDEDIKKLIEEEIEEQAEEIEAEMYYEDHEFSAAVTHKLPESEEPISFDEHGRVMSRYGDPEWKFLHEDGTMITLRFGQNHQELGFDLSDPLSESLRTIEKILSFYDVPGKDPSKKPLKPSSIEDSFKINHYLLSYLHGKGFLRGNDPKNLELLNVHELRHEIYLRIEQDEGYSRVYRFSKAIAKWARISNKINLPGKFSANFTLKQFWSRGMKKDIAKYVAQKKIRWQAIDFDDLQPMMNTALKYIKDYSRDLIFVERTFEKSFQRRVISGLVNKHAKIEHNEKLSADLADELINHHFSKDSGGAPWLNVEISTNGKSAKYQYILKMPFIEEWKNLLGAAIFMLLIWSAMRINELRNLKMNALRVDGKPLDLKKDAVEQVLDGTRFDLRRTEFKTNKEPGGKDHILPLPKIGALAFATLIELFRGTRLRQQNTFILPAGGFDIHGHGSKGKVGKEGSNRPIGFTSIIRWLYNFCDVAGVEHHHTHKCRKTLATLMINHDPNALELIRKLLCHKSVTMTLEYIMSLPGVCEEIRNHVMETMRNKVVDLLTYGAKGQVAGGAGNRLLDAIAATPKAYKGIRLLTTIQMLVKSLDAANFIIQRTPAAWCIRFPTRIPRTAPCLPPAIQIAIEEGRVQFSGF